MVVPGLFGARRRLRSRGPADQGRARWRPLRRHGPEDLDLVCAICRLDLLPRAHEGGRQEPGRHFLPADRHEDAGHHRAADHLDHTHASSQRSVLRERARAHRQPDRRGEQGLDLRQVPARQRAGRLGRDRQVPPLSHAARASLGEHARGRPPPVAGRALPPSRGRSRNAVDFAGSLVVGSAVGCRGRHADVDRGGRLEAARLRAAAVDPGNDDGDPGPARARLPDGRHAGRLEWRSGRSRGGGRPGPRASLPARGDDLCRLQRNPAQHHRQGGIGVVSGGRSAPWADSCARLTAPTHQ